MMNLFDYVDQHELNQLVMDNMISARMHPEAPLTILNYTHHAQASGDWSNETLRKCRGLIYNYDTREIVAVPWQKFFNYGDPNTGELRESEPVIVTDKSDGSLGILYHTPDGRIWVATRGSFTSDQALHATEWLRTRMPDLTWGKWLTPLVEIVYPENRIVLNYGDRDTLILLGSVMTSNVDNLITYIPPESTRRAIEWEGDVTQTFEAESLAEALALPPRENAEGVVVQFITSGKMVKVKQEDYLRLHRILYSLSNKFIWEQIIASEGECAFTLDPEIAALLPPEILEWIYATEDDYWEAAHEVYVKAMNHLERYDYLQLSKDYHKIVALSVKDEPKDIRSAVLMQMRFGLAPDDAMRKIMYWQGYGTFTRPQNVENEDV